jgi:hypothetical protein
LELVLKDMMIEEVVLARELEDLQRLREGCRQSYVGCRWRFEELAVGYDEGVSWKGFC